MKLALSFEACMETGDWRLGLTSSTQDSVVGLISAQRFDHHGLHQERLEVYTSYNIQI